MSLHEVRPVPSQGRQIQSNNWLIAIVLVLASGMSACQTAPTRFSEKKEGKFTAKVLVKDKKANKSYILNLKMLASVEEKLRMDVTTPLGTHLASLAMNQDNLEYMLIKKKAFYRGQPKPGALRPIISIPLDPRVLTNILFDKPIENKNWVCSKDGKGYVESCVNRASRLKIKWTDRRGDRRTVFIDHPQASLQMNFTQFQPKVELGKSVFHLKPPKSFKIYRIK